MVVIVVVASVMVYAWSTGLLGTLLVTPQTGKEVMNIENSAFIFFFFNDTAPTKTYTLSLHDALPISCRSRTPSHSTRPPPTPTPVRACRPTGRGDRKSTRLNSSHANISYAVFCL